MNSFKSTSRYKVLSSLGAIMSCFLIFFGSISLFVGHYFSFLYMFLPGVVILYLLFVAFPKEIIVDDEKLIFKSRLRESVIKLTDISEVKPHYTTRTLTLSGGNLERAAIYYSIKVKNKPMNLFLFGSGLDNFKDLYMLLNKKIGYSSK